MDLLVTFAYAVGSVVCHQLPERSFFVAGMQLPVCARCTGLYVSGGVGLLGYAAARLLAWRPRGLTPRAALSVLIVATAPTAVSFGAGVAGLWDGANVTRAVLAVPLGLAAGGIVAAVAAKDLR